MAQTPDAVGIFTSRVFSGLRLPVELMLAGKLADVLAAVQEGVQTPEHAAFVGQLNCDA